MTSTKVTHFRATFCSNELYNKTPVVRKRAFQDLKADKRAHHNQLQ